jgi:tRNA threonylcarbamoyl adenosine modification protein YjeE
VIKRAGGDLMTYISHSVEETEAIGAEFGKSLSAGTVVAYMGDLGMGKTAFTRGIAKGMGFTGRVTSPTFTIVNEYPSDPPLYHFDLYRLDGEDELFDIELKANKVVIKYPIQVTPVHCPTKKQLIQWGEINHIKGIPGLYLSEFYILELKIGDLHKSILCKVPTKNMPNDRDRWIYKDAIDTREKFMSYVSLMLTEEPSLLLSNEEFVSMINGLKSNQHIPSYVEIYEQLLRIANTNPHRLLDINKLVLHLDADVVPKEFMQMLAQFQKIIKQLERL